MRDDGQGVPPLLRSGGMEGGVRHNSKGVPLAQRAEWRDGAKQGG